MLQAAKISQLIIMIINKGGEIKGRYQKRNMI